LLKPVNKTRFIIKLKYESSTIILFVGINILCVTYFLTPIIMPDPQTSDMRQIWQMMSALPLHQLVLASCEFYV